MCGITGLWAAPSLDQPGALIRTMNGALAYRGPDGDGFWQHPHGIHFGHRRLAIVDLSPTGVQPMRSASGRFTITFNGEVYNFHEIRRQLDDAGLAPKWNGTSDTEVMLAAIEAWGLSAALERFVGMFAFGLWDETEQRLHLVRDRLGVKPLYWTRTPHGLAFASELKALRFVPGFDTTIDAPALAGFLRANCVVGEQSIFRGTHRLAPGTIATFKGPSSNPAHQRYWDPVLAARDGLKNPFAGNEREAIDALDAQLRDAIRLRMVADVPLGAFLSGGVDSSTVVALMQAQSSRPVHTFSIENELESYNEGPAARAVAKHLGTHHTALTVTAADALAVIPKLPMMYDEPFADSSQIPTFLVSQLARKSVTVALSGDGGDELFGGYTRHIWGPRIWNAERAIPSSLRRTVATAIASRSADWWDGFFKKGRPLLPEMRIAGIRMHKAAAALGALTPEAMHAVLSSHWTPNDRVLLSGAESTTSLAPLLRADGASVAEEFMLRDLVGYLPDDILTKVDRASMAVSLEAREPLLDHRLMEFAWKLPLSMKVRGSTGKWVLRQLLARYVPESIISGPKMGFGIPLGAWLRGPLRDWAEALLDPKRLREGGLFDAALVRARWKEHLEGTRPWEFHLWDILMFKAWREANSLNS